MSNLTNLGISVLGWALDNLYDYSNVLKYKSRWDYPLSKVSCKKKKFSVPRTEK